MSNEPTRGRPFVRIVVVVVAIVAAVVIAAQFFSPSDAAAPGTGTNVWTCSMHPQVRLPKPGKWGRRSPSS